METKSVRIRECPSAELKICNLPDPILCHILSFLPSTKEVVATTILSKRWINQWTYVDTLRFDNLSEVHPSDGVPGKMQFSQFVHIVLHLLRAPKIKELKLFCDERGCNEHDITTWITTATSRNVESLDMEFNVEFHLPFFQFNCLTLVELKIAGADFSYVNFRRAPSLPSLKIFDLKTEVICTKWFCSFISGCSALEYLYLDTHYVLDASTLKISSVTLLKIYVAYRYACVKIALDTPLLKSLIIYGRRIKKFLVETDLSYLSVANINLLTSFTVDFDRRFIQKSDTLARLIRSLFNAKVLQLNLVFPKPVTRDLNVRFSNLTTLIICSGFLELKMLSSFMENSTNLKDIHLEKVWVVPGLFDHENETIWVEPKRVPRCLLLSLKKMTIKGIARLDELDVVEYVLNNGKLLEMMDIYCLRPIKEDWQLKFQMLQKITTFRKASERCKTAFD